LSSDIKTLSHCKSRWYNRVFCRVFVANTVPRYFAFVPAAGTGSRMDETLPKQYLRVAGEPLLYHALRVLAAHPQVERVFVVLAPTDAAFDEAAARALGMKIEALRCGGEVRAASVCNGLRAVRDRLSPDDWALVHDAARPCLSAAALERLIREIGDDDVGGLLALPVADTLKRSDGASRVSATEPRAGLWQAQTPQMFRYGALVAALGRVALASVTDEAGAMEAAGFAPKLVMGEARNLKVTYPDDLALAELILAGYHRPYGVPDPR
jgi:2-C-methyl-D-erythritol 4-phosphate cytidylyltransferase